MVTTPHAGIAYGVFKCSDPRPMSALIGRFKEALDNIKAAHEETKIPPETEFSVFDLRRGRAYAIFVDNASGLAQKVEALEKDGANYLIRSSLPDADRYYIVKEGGYFCIPLVEGGEHTPIPATSGGVAANYIAARDLGDVMDMLYGGTELFDAENDGRERRVMDILSRNDNGEFVSQLAVGLAQRARGE